MSQSNASRVTRVWPGPSLGEVSAYPRERVLGHPVDSVGMDEAVAAIVARGTTGRGGYVCLTNVDSTVTSQSLPPLRRAAENSYLSVPDGMPLVWILQRRGHRSAGKVTGIELIPRVARAGRSDGLRHYFYGGAPGVAQAAADRLVKMVPGTLIAGAASPPFGSIDELEAEDLARRLRETPTDVVWVGLGAPKQELWMAKVTKQIEGPVLVGVGAAFDFLAGTKKAAPRFISRLGFEWLYRLLTEPRRLWRRYLVGNTRFIWLLARSAGRGS